MRLTLIQIDETSSRLRSQFERYPPQFQSLFAAAGADIEWQTVLVLDGDPFPDPATLDGIVITGSKYGVYDSPVWIEPLREFIRAAYAAKTPMLAVCFGHQILADALGGDVRLAPNGWQLGRQIYRFTDDRPACFDDLPETIALLASHQDQVISPPTCATTFLAAPGCPHAGLVYDNGAAISLQPHPEFDRDYATALVGLHRGNPLSADEVAALVRRIDGPLDDLPVAKALAACLGGR
ncbi:type 1 glutamine amidotransferase [uncultured Maricaulis sp.]|uniref:type 1 glutamine amidotransferase n=1 Tax=uncultured Maricaulis sp. TaxID=174710 RepID=UPI0030D9B556|tara:strand:- start:62575 stop:63288 length:714 start_codon:yes stop_codon:yes gene_type:complete